MEFNVPAAETKFAAVERTSRIREDGSPRELAIKGDTCQSTGRGGESDDR